MNQPLKLKPRAQQQDAFPGEAAQPAAVIVMEDVRWMHNGALRAFTEGTVVTEPADIALLRERGANLKELKEITP